MELFNIFFKKINFCFQGNSDNGPVARFMNSEAARPHVVGLFFFDHGDTETPIIIADLLQRHSVILRVLNSTETIKVKEFRQYEIDTNLIMVEEPKIKFMTPNRTIHKFIGHGWEAILKNNCRGLGELAEGALEGGHQNVKFGQKNCARKFEVSAMFKDMYTSLYFVQAPSVRQFRPVRRSRVKKNLADCYKGDDAIVESFFVKEGENYVQDLQF